MNSLDKRCNLCQGTYKTNSSVDGDADNELSDNHVLEIICKYFNIENHSNSNADNNIRSVIKKTYCPTCSIDFEDIIKIQRQIEVLQFKISEKMESFGERLILNNTISTSEESSSSIIEQDRKEKRQRTDSYQEECDWETFRNGIIKSYSKHKTELEVEIPNSFVSLVKLEVTGGKKDPSSETMNPEGKDNEENSSSDKDSCCTININNQKMELQNQQLLDKSSKVEVLSDNGELSSKSTNVITGESGEIVSTETDLDEEDGDISDQPIDLKNIGLEEAKKLDGLKSYYEKFDNCLVCEFCGDWIQLVKFKSLRDAELRISLHIYQQHFKDKED